MYQRNTGPKSIGPSAVKRREKRGNYVIGSGNTAENVSAENAGRYGSKRLTHVQQMRLRFENWCQLNEEEKRCEAVHCKNVRQEPQFDSLPIITYQKIGRISREGADKAHLAESPLIQVTATALTIDKPDGAADDDEEEEEGAGGEEEATQAQEASLTCDCDSSGDKEEFRENGKPNKILL